MFGYRLIRERDFDRLQSDLEHARLKVELTSAEYIKSLLMLAEAKAQAAAGNASVAHLTVSANTAHKERAIWQAKITGMPAVAPEIVGTGHPLAAEGIGAGVDMFEDVGDARAHQMGELGLLNGSERTVFPGAAGLTESAAQE